MSEVLNRVNQGSAAAIPLVVDLDGTLLKTDTLYEQTIAYVKGGLTNVFKLAVALTKGKCALKSFLSKNTQIDCGSLPVNEKVLEFVKSEYGKGREIILATGAYETVANKVSNRFGLFSKVLATNDSVNLTGQRKATALVDQYGEKGFDYIGNSTADLPVWKKSRSSHVANPAWLATKAAKSCGNLAEIFVERKSLLMAIISSLRVYQWAKNGLIFVPLLTSHLAFDLSYLFLTIIGFLVFSLCASANYILNDLIDLEHDRNHHRKKNRALAAADIGIFGGIVTSISAFSVGLTLALLFLPVDFILVTFIYLAISQSYTFYFKSVVMFDVVILASLYTIRIVAGAASIDIPLTFWILAFSMFIFLSLALIKRYTEILTLEDEKADAAVNGRGYIRQDAGLLMSLGTASGFVSVLVLALYIRDEKTIQMYGTPEIIWLACPILLYWVGRMWFVSHRGMMHDDPLLFAMKDKVSLLLAVLLGIVFVSAL